MTLFVNFDSLPPQQALNDLFDVGPLQKFVPPDADGFDFQKTVTSSLLLSSSFHVSSFVYTTVVMKSKTC